MAYCSLEDLLQKIPLSTLVQLTNDDPEAAELDMGIVNGCIQSQSELIDASLRGRYPLPLSVVPTLVNSIAVNLVRYELYDRRPDGGDLPDAVKAGHKNATGLLKQIASGDLSLGIATTGASVPENGPWRVKAPPRRFGLGE